LISFLFVSDFVLNGRRATDKTSVDYVYSKELWGGFNEVVEKREFEQISRNLGALFQSFLVNEKILKSDNKKRQAPCSWRACL
jgi:hypothetical protein